MDKDYQVISPDDLGYLVCRRELHRFAVVALYWLIKRLRVELADDLKSVELEIIRVTYYGSYPALGVHYIRDEGSDIHVENVDVGPIIESTIETILRKTPAIELIDLIGDENISWEEMTRKIMEEPSAT
jgi:hypothetical protein